LPSAVIESVPEDDKAKPKAGVADKATDSKEDAKATDEKERLRTGRFTEQIDESKNSYWAFVPEDYNPAFGYALAVWLHPPGDTLEATVYDLWKSSCEQRGIILLGPKAADLAAGWQANETEFVRDTVASFQKKYSIDASRIVLHGYSKSGPFATHLAFKHRDLFRGLVLAASPLSEPPPENLPEYRLQFHLVCGSKDKLHPLVEQHVTGLRKLKFPVSFTSLAELEHHYPGTDGVEAIVRWIDLLDRL
jgi:serine protease Do